MRKVLSLIFAITVMCSLVGCNSIEKNKVKTSSETTGVSSNDSTYESDKNKTDSTKEDTKVGKIDKINIKIGNNTFTATLEDNNTAKALVKQLPLTVDMSELNGNEKYNYLSRKLNADKSYNPGTINEGDLMLYGDNCLVLFYKSFNTSYNYVKLGRINNISGLYEALGAGNVNVTFSVS